MASLRFEKMGKVASLLSFNWGYYLGLSIVKVISYTPFWLLYILSDILFFPLYYVLRYRRKIVRRNLTESFPGKSIDEIIGIEKEFYHFFIDLILESCKLLSVNEEEIKRRFVFVNKEVINDRLKEGKNVSAFIGHYGNWEWLTSCGLWFVKEAKMAQIYHEMHNKSADKLIRKIRERMGNECVEMHKTARFAMQAAEDKRAYLIGFIADQSPGKKESTHFVDFLNHEVPVLVGTEKITKRLGFEAIYVSIRRLKRGYYECVLSPLHDNPASLPDYELTYIYYKRLEEDIRRHPELYLWSHNRFKFAHRNND